MADRFGYYWDKIRGLIQRRFVDQGDDTYALRLQQVGLGADAADIIGAVDDRVGGLIPVRYAKQPGGEYAQVVEVVGVAGGSGVQHSIGGNTAGVLAIISSGTYLLAGGDNITLSQNGNSVTISGATAAPGPAGSNTAGISNLGNTAGTSGVISGSAIALFLAGGNNVTLSQSINGSSATITVSAANSAAQSVQTQMTGLTAGISTQGNTLGTTGLVSHQLLLVGGNSITLSQSVNAQSATLTIIGPSQSVQTQMTGLSAGMSTGGNTLGDTGIKSNRLVLIGGNNITLSGSTNAESMSITISAANETQTVPAIATAVKVVQSSGSTGTITRFAPEDHAHQGVAGIDVNGVASTFFGTQQLSAGAMISLVTGGNTSRGTVQIVDLWSSATTVSSVATANAIGAMASRLALEGHQHGGVPTVSVVGNTSGNTTQGNMSLVLAGGDNITLSGATAAGVMTVSISAAPAGAGGAATLPEYWPDEFLRSALILGSTLGQNTIYIAPYDLGEYISAYRVNFYLSYTAQMSASNATGAAGHTLSWCLYSRGSGTNSTRIESYISRSAFVAFTNSSNTRLQVSHPSGISNSTAVSSVSSSNASSNISTYLLNSVAGFRVIPFPVSSTITPGRYWMAVANSTSTAGLAGHSVNASIVQVTKSNYAAFQHFGTSSSASNASFYNFNLAGSYSATSGAFPQFINFSSQLRGATNQTNVYWNISGYSTATNIQ